MRFAGLMAAMLMMVAAPARAEDDMVDLSTPATFAAALQAAKYKAQVKQDEQGNPYILSAANGSEFTVDFYDCKAGKCSSAQLTSWYKAEPLFTIALANEWNNQFRFLRVSIGDTGNLREFVDLTTVGKVSRDNFADIIDWYVQMDAEFARFIEKKRNEAKAKDTKAGK